MSIHFLNADGSLKSVEYTGKVLKVEKNKSYQIMSDIWGYCDDALVWDDVDNKPKLVSIRWCDYEWDTNSYAEVDATNEVKEKYRLYRTDIEYKRVLGGAYARASEIVKGCTIEVVKGRKVPKGTKGKVVVAMMREAGYGWKRSLSLKLGVATSDEMIEVVRNGKVYKNHKDMVWVWAYNCKRLDVDAVNEDALWAEAAEKVRAQG